MPLARPLSKCLLRPCTTSSLHLRNALQISQHSMSLLPSKYNLPSHELGTNLQIKCSIAGRNKQEGEVVEEPAQKTRYKSPSGRIEPHTVYEDNGTRYIHVSLHARTCTHVHEYEKSH